MSRAPLISVDGHVLNDRFAITDLARPFPEGRVELAEASGPYGSTLVSHAVGTRRVSFRVWAFGRDHERLLEDFRWLATLLHGDGLMELSISDEGGRTRMVRLDGELDYDEYEERASMPVTLTQPDPRCDVGAPCRVTVPSGGSARIAVAYRLPKVIVTAEAAKRGTGNLWGLRFDEGDVLRVRIPTAAASSVSIDCETCEVRVAGAVSMVTLDSDWPELEAGEHVVRMDVGSGAAVLTWQERSL